LHGTNNVYNFKSKIKMNKLNKNNLNKKLTQSHKEIDLLNYNKNVLNDKNQNCKMVYCPLG
jgi:hypothetical protein